MPTVTWATTSTAAPMGQQLAENALQAAIKRAAGPEWQFQELRIGSLRSHADRRFPAGVYYRAPLIIARAIGASCYRRRGLVHRFDLRLPPAGGREVLTVHDLPPLRFTDEGSMPRSAAEGARRAALVVCPSRFAAREVGDLLGVAANRLRVVPNGVGHEFLSAEPASDELLCRLGIREPFVLHAAGATLRKNLGALAAAWRSLHSEFPELSIVLCGPPDPRRDAHFSQSGGSVIVGRLEQDMVAAVMRRAALVVVPSVYEGFGLPALEGMACGRPVVASAVGALPEVCGDAALLVEPTPEGLAQGMAEVLSDQSRAKSLADAGRERATEFSWDRAAEDYLRVYSDVLES